MASLKDICQWSSRKEVVGVEASNDGFQGRDVSHPVSWECSMNISVMIPERFQEVNGAFLN